MGLLCDIYWTNWIFAWLLLLCILEKGFSTFTKLYKSYNQNNI